MGQEKGSRKIIMVSHALSTCNAVMQCLRMQEHQHASAVSAAVQTYNIATGTLSQYAQGMCSVELKFPNNYASVGGTLEAYGSCRVCV